MRRTGGREVIMKWRWTVCGRMRTTLVAVAWGVFAGCGDTASRGDWTTVRDTLPSGTVRVTNIPPANAAPTWTVEEELRVGSVDGAGPEVFAYLKGLVVLDGGAFVVLDSEAQELRVFSSDDDHVATHGGRGQGPGEFRDANGLMLGPSGRIWVPDARNGRMSVFDPEDGFIESFRFVDDNYGWMWNGAMVDGSRIYRPWWDGTREQVRVYDLTMTRIDSLPLSADPPEDEQYDPARQPGTFYLETDGGYRLYSIPFFAPEVRYIDARGAVWSTREGDPEYRMTRWHPGGDTTLLVETRRPAVPVPAAARDSVIDGMRETLSNMGVGRQFDWSRIPSVKPAVEAIFQSAEGNLWVRTPSGGEGALFDVYSGDGAHLGTASLESGLDLFDRVAPVVRGDTIWLIATDELDVQYVVRGRIRAS